MKHTIKICASILLALVVVLSVCLMVGCDDETKDPATTPTAADRGGVVATGTAPDSTTWTVYESGELAITGKPANGIMYDYNSNISVPAWKAYANDITGVTLSNDIKVISADAFSSMKNIVWVQFGTGLENIGTNAFRSCSNLRRVILPNGVKTIGASAFDGCYRMYELDLPDTVTQINNSAFTGCSSLLTVHFPKGDVQVATGVFSDSIKLIEVITENKDVEAGDDKYFGGVAAHATTAGVHTPDKESILKNENGFLLDSNRLMGYVGTETNIVLPSSVGIIADYAFYANTAITSVDTGNKVTSIGKSAFGACTGLKTLTIGTKVNKISAGAFTGCGALETLNFNAAAYAKVAAIDGMFENCTALTTINFLDSYTSFPTGEGMFRGCTALTEVTLPNIATIPDGMFEGCTGLKKVTFLSSNKTIGAGAFRNCTALSDLDLTQLASSATISEYAFEGCSAIVTIDLTNVKSVKEGAFNYCKALTGVVIGKEFDTPYKKQCFDGCTKLVDVVNNSSKNVETGETSQGGVAKYTTFEIGTGASRLKETAEGYLFFETADANYLVGYVGTAGALTLPANYNNKSYSIIENAFSNNAVIESVKIGAGVTTIGEGAFRGCVNLKSVDYTGSTITKIERNTFDGCKSLAVLTLTTEITEIGETAFRDTKQLGELNLMNVSTVGVRAFQNSGITKLTAGETLVEIKNDVFSGCERLAQVTLPNVVTIGDQAFANCIALTALSIPKAETIGKYAFYHNSALAALSLPAGKTVAQGAFQECGGLVSVALGENMTEIGTFAFRDCGKLVCVINRSAMTLSVDEVGPGYVTRYAEVVASAENDMLKTVGDYVYMVIDGATYLLAYTGSETTITLPTPAELGCENYDIFRYAFWASAVENVTIPDGVKNIGYGAFAYSALKTIVLPASVETFSGAAFESSALRTITGHTGLVSIGATCFKNCYELVEFEMPNSLTQVGMAAFRNCKSLRKVTVSTGLTSLPAYVFDGCVSLYQLVLPKKITVGTKWCAGCDKFLEIWALSGLSFEKVALYTRPDISVSVNMSANSSRTKTDENGFVFYSYNGANYLVDYIGTETNLVLPAKSPEGSTYQIFNYAFYNRDDIETIRFSDRVIGVGRYAFAGCDNLKGIYLPTTLTDKFGVGENLFWDCSDTLVVATGFASAEDLPEDWDEDFNAQSPAGSYNVVYGVTYDLFVTMLK